MSRLDPSDVPHSQESRLGVLYAFTHVCMPGVVKIGASRKHPIQRATELSAGTGVPGMFTVAYYRWFDDAFEAESTIHEMLLDVRVDPAREFFRIDVGEAIHLIRQLGEELGGDGREGGEWVEKGLIGETHLSRRAAELYPFAALFASFDPDGPDELTEAERAQCRDLERRQVLRSLSRS